MADEINSICAFDVSASSVAAVRDSWPDTAEVPGGGYRWLHFDLAEPALPAWCAHHLPNFATQGLLQPETRPRAERFEDGLLFQARGVNMNAGEAAEDMVSLRIWVTKDLIVSARARRVFAVDDMRKRFEEGRAPATTGEFLARLAQSLVARIETVSVALEDDTDRLEDTLLDTQGTPSMVAAADVAPLRRKAIKLRRYVAPQSDALQRIPALELALFSKSNLIALREASNRTMRSVEELDAVRDRLAALSDHLDAARINALGRNGYVLSVVAAIFLPLGFLTGLFGVNVAGMPGLNSPSAFAILCLSSGAIGLALYLWFRRKGWL